MQQEEFNQKIQALFDDELASEETLVFMQQVADDAAFSQAFNTEMQLRYGMGEQDIFQTGVQVIATDDAFAPATEHLAMVKQMLEAKDTSGKEGKVSKVPVRKLWPKMVKIAAAILLLVGLGIGIKFLLQEPKPVMVPPGSIAHGPDTFPAPKVAPLVQDTPVTQMATILPSNKDSAIRSYFQQLIKDRYTSGYEDPVAVDRYYYAYKKRWLKELTLYDNDFTTKGGNNDSARLAQYANFYKGVAHLELNETRKALKLLVPLLKEIGKEQELYAPLLWYTGLAYMKIGDLSKAIDYWQECASTPSNRKYQDKAIKAMANLAKYK